MILALLFVAAIVGIALLLGKGNHRGWPFSLIGALVLTAVTATLVKTAARWAGYFCALCAITAVKAALSLLFGVTISSGHLPVDRPYAAEFLVALVALTLLTLRFTQHVPKSKLDRIALTVGVLALACSMIVEPELWPLAGAIFVTGIAWMIDRRTKHSHRTSQGHRS